MPKQINIFEKIYIPDNKVQTKKDFLNFVKTIIHNFKNEHVTNDNRKTLSWQSDIKRVLAIHEDNYRADPEGNKYGPKGTAMDYFFSARRLKGDNFLEISFNMQASLDTVYNSLVRIVEMIESTPETMSNLLSEKELTYRDAQIISLVDNLVFAMLFTHEALYYSMESKEDTTLSDAQLRIIADHGYAYIGTMNQMNKKNMDDKLSSLFKLSAPMLGNSLELLQSRMTKADSLYALATSHFNWNPLFAIGKLIVRTEMWYLDRQRYLSRLYEAKLVRYESERNNAITQEEKDRIDKIIKTYENELRKANIKIMKIENR